MKFRTARRYRELMFGTKPLSKSERTLNLEYLFQRTIWPKLMVEKIYAYYFKQNGNHKQAKEQALSYLLEKQATVNKLELNRVNANLAKDLSL